MTVEERRRRRFSEPFKIEQVNLIESGKISIWEVSKLYEVKAQNVKRWLKKYGKKELPPTMLITSSNDYDRIRSLEKEVKKLKEIIGGQQVKIIVQDKIIKKASEKLGTGFEKK